MKVTAQEIECLSRSTVPNEDENIIEDLGIDAKELEKTCTSIAIYQRDSIACPYGRGNWIIDFLKEEYVVFCFKLPLEMTKKQVDKYCRPLLDIYCYGAVESHGDRGVLQ